MQINTIINDIENGIEDSLSFVNQGANSTKDGLILVNESGKAFGEIKDAVLDVTTKISEVTIAMDNMKNHIAEVVTTLRKL
ncbi:hypothetical protein ACA29_13850 [Lederbergia galactosidilytica]|uniref:Methyl-accepting chemotaxis protein n=1 Tax=Lederbergia galactosidilytica TaxID=217031 RepID=A0A0Q9Y7X5_9BACI|nr:hypothetical protein ACA29_13850 [Lederbergia galactosidilytica]